MTRKRKIKQTGQKSIWQNLLQMLSNFFAKDLKIKIFGLLFAMIFWIYTILGNQYTYIFSVPLNVINVTEGKTLKEPVAERVQAEFTGKGSDLVFLFLTTTSAFRFDLDLHTIKYFFNFNLMDYFNKHPENVITPPSLEIKFNKIVSPDSITIELDTENTRKIPVEPKIFIDTEPGYIKTAPLQIEPDFVEITGPNFYVKQIDRVFTESLVRENVNLTLEMDLNLDVPQNTTVQYSTKKVHIRQQVEQIGEKIIKDIPVSVINIDDGLNVEVMPEFVSLKVSGGLSHLTELNISDFKIIFDYQKSWQAGESYYTPEIQKPKEVVDIIEVIPNRINVRVIRERVSK